MEFPIKCSNSFWSGKFILWILQNFQDSFKVHKSNIQLDSTVGTQNRSADESIACLQFREFNIIDLLSDTISAFFSFLSAVFWDDESYSETPDKGIILSSFLCGIDRSDFLLDDFLKLDICFGDRDWLIQFFDLDSWLSQPRCGLFGVKIIL